MRNFDKLIEKSTLQQGSKVMAEKLGYLLKQKVQKGLLDGRIENNDEDVLYFADLFTDIIEETGDIVIDYQTGKYDNIAP